MDWVSVKDRLPESGEAVLTCNQDDCDIGFLSSTNNDGPDWQNLYFFHISVTHWMPLPSPPERNHNGMD